MALSQQEQAILDYGVKNGKSKQEVTDAISKYRTSLQTSQPIPKETVNPIKQFATNMVTTAIDAISGAGKKVEASGNKYQNSPNALIPNAYNTNLPLSTNLKNTALNVAHDVGAIGGGVAGAIASPITTAVAPVVKPVVSAIANTDTAQALKSQLDEWTKQNPEKAALIGDTANLASFLSLGLAPSSNVSDLHPIDATKNALGTMVSDVKTGVNALSSATSAVKNRVISTIDDFGSSVTRPDVTDATAISLNPKKAGAIPETQLSVGGKLKKLSDVTPEEYAKMQSSTETSLNKFTQEAEKYKNNRNPLNDPTEIVGQRVDKALSFADKKRQAVGAKMGDIEKKYTNQKLEIGDKAYTKFTDTIKSFENPKYGIDGADAKVVRKLVDDFDKLQKGGATIGERLDFVRSWDKYLHDAKDAFGNFKENATANTRIQNAVMEIKDETVGAISAQDKIYRGLRSQYSTYKKLNDVGDSLLGKDGMLGDKIKGGATVKRAIMSNSDAGARQFLIKLKELTGYDAIKEADLALTAMKNVGDYQGLSLLQVLNEGKSGFVRKVLEKTQDAVVGNNATRINNFVKDTKFSPEVQRIINMTK